MHIVTGLGQIFKPRPKVTPKLPPKALQKAAPRVGYVAKNGHRRFCGAASGATVSCDLTLKAKFRRSFEEFSAKSKMPTQNGWKDLPHDDS
jgi:ribosomal protein S30